MDTASAGIIVFDKRYVTTFLMLEMTAMFIGILNRAYSTVTNIGAALWIMDPAVNTAASPIPLPDYVLDAVRSMDEVSYAVPVTTRTSAFWLPIYHHCPR